MCSAGNLYLFLNNLASWHLSNVFPTVRCTRMAANKHNHVNLRAIIPLPAKYTYLPYNYYNKRRGVEVELLMRIGGPVSFVYLCHQ